jgi:hypothetical protein
MTKGSYTRVRECIASKINEDNETLVAICQKHLPRIPLKQLKQYVARAAWQMRGETKKTTKNSSAPTKAKSTRSKK